MLEYVSRKEVTNMNSDKIEIHGFKCFNKGLITRYGDKMKIGEKYISNDKPVFQHNGFHMCERLEDTLRYFDAFEGEVDICKVIGYPPFHEYFDEYYGYYDMYSCQEIEIKELLTREQIIEEADKMNDMRFRRFLTLYHLNEEELKKFMKKYIDNRYVFSHLICYYYDKNIYKKLSEGLSYETAVKKYTKKLDLK